MKFGWVTLIVNNFDDTLKFYKEVVGLKLVTMINNAGDGGRIAFLGDQGTKIQILEHKDIKHVSMGRQIYLGFTVDSLADTIEHLKSNQVKIHSGPFQPSPDVRFIYVLDPNGLKVQFAQILNHIF